MMMPSWFKSWHGAPTDPKWRIIAKRAGTSGAIVSAIWWELLDHASQADVRGDIAHFDVETYAEFAGLDQALVDLVINELKAKGVIVGTRISSWERRQRNTKEDPTAAERQRRRRMNAAPPATQSHAMSRHVTPEKSREEETREDQTREDQSKDMPPAEDQFPAGAAPIGPDPPKGEESDYFDRGGRILGGKANGLLAKLLKAKSGNIALARAAIEQASTKQDPREYVGAILRDAGSLDPRGVRGTDWW